MCTIYGFEQGNQYIEGDERNPHSAFRSTLFSSAPRQSLQIKAAHKTSLLTSASLGGKLDYGQGEAWHPCTWFKSAKNAGN